MKCKNCRNLVKRIDDDGTLYDFCGMVIDSPDTEKERNCKYYVVATNADRIRSMSNGELAQFLYESFGCSMDCPAYDTCDAQGACVEFLAKWLQQEVE